MAGIKISDLPPATIPLVGDEQLELEDASGDSKKVTVDNIVASISGLDATFVTVTANAALPNERILTEGNGISIVDNGAGNSIVVSATSGGLSGLGEWRYRTETVTPPADGQIRFNNSDPALATELYIAETNDGSTDVGAFLGLLTAGSLIYIQEKADSANFIVVEVGTNTDSGTFATIGIANIIQQGSALSQNTRVILVINLTGAATGANIIAGTVDGQVTIWDVGNNQWEPVNDAILRINPAAPPTSPLGRISAAGFNTTDVRKSFLHMNIGASVGTVWSTDEEGGTPSGFYSRSSFNFDLEHDWGFWNPANQTGLPIFRMTEDSEFIFNLSSFYDERAAALASVAGRGQVWVRDDIPNVLVYTDDAGTDFVLNAGAGDVFKVGTPVDNQVGVWTGDGTLEGDENFLWDGTKLSLLSVSGVVGLDFFSDGATGDFRTQGSNISRWIMSGWAAGQPKIFLNATGNADGFSINSAPSDSLNSHHVNFESVGGAGRLEIGAQPGDGTSAASVDFGRRTDTTSGLELRMFRGDGSAVSEITLGTTLTGVPGVNIKEGLPLIIQALSGGGKFDSSHDNVDFNTAFTTTTDWNITGLSGRIKQDAETLAFVSELQVPNDAVQARRTTGYVLTTAFVDVTLDVTDVETDDAVLNHDLVTNTDNIIAVVAGTYKISYQFNISNASAVNTIIEAQARVRLNDAGTGIPGSLAATFNMRNHGTQLPTHLTCDFIVTLSASDFITLQAQKIELDDSQTYTLDEVSVKAVRLL